MPTQEHPYLQWAKHHSHRPHLEKPKPFVSARKDGRNLSSGDLAFHYLDKRVPLMLFGKTGTGKTTLVEYYCYQKNRSMVLPPIGRSLEQGFALQGYLEGQSVTLAGSYLLAYLFDALCHVDFVGVQSSDQFKQLASLAHNAEIECQTHLGSLTLKWTDRAQLVLSDCFYDCPDWETQDRYAFVWHEMTDELDKLESVVRAQLRHARISSIQRTRGSSAEDVERLKRRFEKSQRELERQCEPFVPRTIKCDKVVGVSARALGRQLSAVLPKLEKIIGFDLPAELRHQLIELYHPAMAQADYEQVLVDCLVHPAYASAWSIRSEVDRAKIIEAKGVISEGVEKIFRDL